MKKRTAQKLQPLPRVSAGVKNGADVGMERIISLEQTDRGLLVTQDSQVGRMNKCDQTHSATLSCRLTHARTRRRD